MKAAAIIAPAVMFLALPSLAAQQAASQQPAPAVGCQAPEVFKALQEQASFSSLLFRSELMLSSAEAYEEAHPSGEWPWHHRHRGESASPKEGPAIIESAQQAAEEFQNWLKKNGQAEYPTPGGCAFTVEKFGQPLLKLLLVGIAPNVQLLSPGIPFLNCTMGSTEGVILSTVVSSEAYNTLKLDSGQRAARVFSSTALPILLDMERGLSGTPAEFYGVIVVYEARNFLNDAGQDNGGLPATGEAEVLALVATRQACQDLDDGQITEDEFAEKSDTFLLSGGAGAHLLKIKLKLE